MTRFLLVLAVGCTISTAALAADEPPQIDAKDIQPRDARAKGFDLVGKPVTITGCSFISASDLGLSCRAVDRSGGIYIDGASMLSATDLVRAVKACPAHQFAAPTCFGSVTGVIDKVDDGSFVGPYLQIVKAKIDWSNGEIGSLDEIDAAGVITKRDGTIIKPDGTVLRPAKKQK